MKYMPALMIPKFILLSICEVVIIIWSYPKNLDQSQHLFLPMANGNLKDVHLG